MTDAGERAREIADHCDHVAAEKTPIRAYDYDPEPAACVPCIAAALTALETANAELRRDRDSIIAATKAVGIGWRENEDGAEIPVNMSAARYQAYADVLMDQGEAIARERDALKAEVERLRAAAIARAQGTSHE